MRLTREGRILVNAVWRQWPFLNNVRFRLFRVDPMWMVGNENYEIVLILQTQEMKGSTKPVVVLTEVIDWHQGQLLTQQTAHCMPQSITVREAVEITGTRACSNLACELRVDGVQTFAYKRLNLKSGMMLTIIVRDAVVGDLRFRIPHEENRIQEQRPWSARDQVFPHNGPILVIRVQEQFDRADTRVRIPVETWHTWAILCRKLSKHWSDFRQEEFSKFDVNRYWMKVRELRANMKVIIVTDSEISEKDQPILLIVRNSLSLDTLLLALIWPDSITYMEILHKAGIAELCDFRAVDCAVYKNGRSMRFVSDIRLREGDIIEIKTQLMTNACTCSSGLNSDSSDEEVSFMQQPTPPTTLSTRSVIDTTTAASSGPPPVDYPEHFITQDAALSAVRTFLREYWQATPWYSTQTELRVHCVSFGNSISTVTDEDCPADLLESPTPGARFRSWCLGVCRSDSPYNFRAFPAAYEFYQNVPTVLLVAECRGRDAPIIVQIVPPPDDDVSTLVYVATQSVMLHNIIDWVEEHYLLDYDFEIRINGVTHDPREIVAFLPGDLMVIAWVDSLLSQQEGTYIPPGRLSNVGSSGITWESEVDRQDDEHTLMQLPPRERAEYLASQYAENNFDDLRPPGNPDKSDKVGDAALPIELDRCIPTSETQLESEITAKKLETYLDFDFGSEQLDHDFDKLRSLAPEFAKRLQELYWCLMEDWYSPNISSIEVYTDGSFDGKYSSWAFAIVFYEHNDLGVLGFQYGMVDLTVTSNSCLGEARRSAHTGELFALVHATWWLIRFTRVAGWTGDINFWWDATTAGRKASGDNKAQDPVGKLVRMLQQSLETLHHPNRIEHHHVKAHTGSLFNELVDSAAKQALIEQGMQPPTHQGDGGLLARLIQDHCASLPWLWRFFGKTTLDAQLPEFSQGKMIVQRPTADIKPKELSLITNEMMLELDQSRGHKEVDCHLTIATYNVMSLAEDEPTLLHQSGRAALLRAQFDHAGIGLAGLQETRTQQGTIQSRSHIRFCSGSDQNGLLGVELWVSLAIPIGADAKGREHYFKPNEFAVLKADPRRLFVHCRNGFMNVLIVVAHSPHSGDKLDTRRQWWTELGHDLQALADGKEIIMRLDANARIGESRGWHVGDLADNITTVNGQFLIDILEEFQLMLPATFADYHWGTICTWTHPASKTESRLDYIAIPVSWGRGHLASWVASDIHAGHAAVDHACAVFAIAWKALVQPLTKTRRGFDKVALQRPEARPILQEIVQNAPQPDWNVNASVHSAQLTSYIRNELVKAFPNERSMHQRAVASEEATKLCKQITRCKRELRPYKKMHRDLALRRFFCAWKGELWQEKQLQWAHRLQLRMTALQRELYSMSRDLKLCLRRDRNGFLQDLVSKTQGLNVAEVFRLLKPLMHKARVRNASRPLPRIEKLDGQFCKSLEEVSERWTEHYAALEGGRKREITTFVLEQIKRQSVEPMPDWQKLEDLPSLLDLEAALHRVHINKAMGPDAIPGEILHLLPRECARLLFPLLMKFATTLSEPLQWKGGKLISLYKGKGSMSACASFRGILLMSTIGKAIRASMRAKVNEPFVLNSSTTQFGGKPQQSVIFGAQIVRHFCARQKARNASAIILFCDITSAFYRLLRQIAVGANTSDEDVAAILKRLGLKEDVMETLHSALQGHTAYDELGATGSQKALLAESLQGTWFRMEQGSLVETTMGTRPGDSWADVTFNVLFSAVLSEVLEELRPLGATISVPNCCEKILQSLEDGEKAEEVLHSTWADDLAVMLAVESPAQAERISSLAAQSLLSSLAKRGMEASIGAAKTAILMCLRGQGAIQAKRRIFCKSDPIVPVILEHKTVQIPIVTQYKHLGGILNAKSTLMDEVHARIGKAKSGFGRIAKTILRNKQIALETRTQICEVTAMSILQWGVGAWPILQKGEWKCWEAACWHLMKLLSPCRLRPDLHTSNDEIFLSLNMQWPGDRIQAARIRHLGSMVIAGPNALWGMFRQDPQSTAAMQRSLEWFWNGTGRDQDVPSKANWEAWRVLILTNYPKWKSKIKAVVRRYQSFRHREARCRQWYRTLLHEIEEAGGFCQTIDASSVHLCLLCQRAFVNKRAWFLHANQKHSYVSMVGEIVKGTRCYVCAKEYFHQQKLHHHLRYSAICRAHFWETRHTEKTEQTAPHSLHPWVRVPEVIATANESVFDRDLCFLTADLDEAVRRFTDDVTADDFALALADRLKSVCTRCAPFAIIHQGFTQWAGGFLKSHDTSLLQALVLVGEWLISVAHELVPESVTADLIDERSRRAISITECTVRCPQIFYKQRFFLHLYSGRRREGDLQTALEAVELPPGTLMSVLSVDIMVGGERCNLMSITAQDLWLRVVREGLALGTGAGPPCESWSIAREQALENGNGPRPIRSADELWGRLDLTKKENLQISVGNTLLTFSLLICFLQARLGLFSFLEHPEEPQQYRRGAEHAASIWRLAAIQWFRQTGLFCELAVEQGFYGAKSAKPTRLLLSGIKAARAREIAQQTKNTQRPKHISIGSEGGRWSTSSLKEYPPQFCHMLAALFAEAVVAQSGSSELPSWCEWLPELCIAGQREETFGPDFQSYAANSSECMPGGALE